MAQCTMLELMLFHLHVIHLVSACFTAIIVTSYYRLTAHHAGWEVAATGSAYRIVLTD